MFRNAFEGGQLRLLSAEDVSRIHAGSLEILERVGIRVALDEALKIYERNGANVDYSGRLVRLPPQSIERALQTAPREIVLAGRDPQNDLHLSSRRVYAGTGGAELNVLDLETGELRPSCLKDIADLALLVDALEHIDYYIRPVVARDIALETLDVNTYYAALANTTKHVMGNANLRESVPQVIEMASWIAGGRHALLHRPIISFITSWMVSPLTLEPGVTRILLDIVNARIPVALSSVAILGLTSPVTMAGNLVLTHAEQLSGIALCQFANPGAPVIYGGCPGVVDMLTLSFSPGSIERQIMNAAVSQLAQHVGIPNYNLAGATDAKLPDAQAGFEKAFGLGLTALAGSNYIHHAAGRIKDGVAAEQYVIDNEIIGMAKRAVAGVRVNEETLAIDEIVAAGPGGRYVDRDHTVRHLRREIFRVTVADRHERSAWEAAGSLDARQRARALARKILSEHHPQPIDGDVDSTIRDRFRIHLPPRLEGGKK